MRLILLQSTGTPTFFVRQRAFITQLRFRNLRIFQPLLGSRPQPKLENPRSTTKRFLKQRQCSFPPPLLFNEHICVGSRTNGSCGVLPTQTTVPMVTTKRFQQQEQQNNTPGDTHHLLYTEKTKSIICHLLNTTTWFPQSSGLEGVLLPVQISAKQLVKLLVEGFVEVLQRLTRAKKRGGGGDVEEFNV